MMLSENVGVIGEEKYTPHPEFKKEVMCKVLQMEKLMINTHGPCIMHTTRNIWLPLSYLLPDKTFCFFYFGHVKGTAWASGLGVFQESITQVSNVIPEAYRSQEAISFTGQKKGHSFDSLSSTTTLYEAGWNAGYPMGYHILHVQHTWPCEQKPHLIANFPYLGKSKLIVRKR